MRVQRFIYLFCSRRYVYGCVHMWYLSQYGCAYQRLGYEDPHQESHRTVEREQNQSRRASTRVVVYDIYTCLNSSLETRSKRI